MIKKNKALYPQIISDDNIGGSFLY